ncbi:MAG: methyl-accepting chemotaxis [Rhodospirillaceae bacterium]|nr:MAG: methyl-accepting chemotaxis [Rhodospirillaceae bacterium]TNC94500.1 MAG: methyl-accepting chemotaxis protein [Stygiobacter sp.]
MIARLLSLLLVLLPVTAPAQSKVDPLMVRALTLKAAALLADEGVEAARPRFHAQGEFRFGEIYVNVIDLNGAWVIYPPTPRNEGKSVLNVTDSDGKLLVREIIKVAEDQGEGWVEYRWLNPASNRIEPKLTFVKRVAGKDLIAYVGLYRP